MTKQKCNPPVLTLIGLLVIGLSHAVLMPGSVWAQSTNIEISSPALRLMKLWTHPDWSYEDDNSGPIPTACIGVAGSISLSNGYRIFTWVANPFDWNASDFLGVNLEVDLQTDDNDQFDNDRIGLMISDIDDASFHSFSANSVHMDLRGNSSNIGGYWDGVSTANRRPYIVVLPSPDTWYRFRERIGKLAATLAGVGITLTELDAGGNPVSVLVAGSIADADLPDDDAPNSMYFMACTIWWDCKNFNIIAGVADNTCFEIVTAEPDERFPFIVISDNRASDHREGFEADLLQIQDRINNTTIDIPAPMTATEIDIDNVPDADICIKLHKKYLNNILKRVRNDNYSL